MWRLLRARALRLVVIGASAWCLGAGCGGKSERTREHVSAGAGVGGGAPDHTGGSLSNGGRSGSTAGGIGAGRGGSAHAGAVNRAGEAGAATGAMRAGGEGAVSGGGAAGETSAGAAGDGGNAGDAGAAGMGKLPPGVCRSPSPFTTGLVGCGNESFVHRPEPMGCPAPPRLSEPRPGIDEECDSGTCDTCNQDMECGPGGYCLSYFSEDSFGYEHECYYPCVSDSDCDTGKICVCQAASRTVVGASSGGLGHCTSATCASDQDCPANHFCSSPINSTTCAFPYPWAAHFACQTSADECSGPEDCFQALESSDEYDACRPTSDGTKLVCSVEIECG